jgi:hypothetical protein
LKMVLCGWLDLCWFIGLQSVFCFVLLFFFMCILLVSYQNVFGECFERICS